MTARDRRHALRGVRQGRVVTSVDVRNLAYLALRENDQLSQVKSRVCETRYAVNPRGVSYIRVFYWALGRASRKTWILRHATFSFPRRRGEPWYDGCGKWKFIDFGWLV